MIVGDELKSFDLLRSSVKVTWVVMSILHSDKKNIKVERQRRNGGLIKTAKDSQLNKWIKRLIRKRPSMSKVSQHLYGQKWSIVPLSRPLNSSLNILLFYKKLMIKNIINFITVNLIIWCVNFIHKAINLFIMLLI